MVRQLMPTFLYLRGCPGTGKKTVADLLKKELGWPFLWSHDFDPVFRAVDSKPRSWLLSALMEPAIQFLLSQRKSVILSRPSREKVTVDAVRKQVENSREYLFLLVTLTASYEIMAERVCQRQPSDLRIYTREGLDEYLESRPEKKIPGEFAINTDSKTPKIVTYQIMEILDWAASTRKKAS